MIIWFSVQIAESKDLIGAPPQWNVAPPPSQYPDSEAGFILVILLGSTFVQHLCSKFHSSITYCTMRALSPRESVVHTSIQVSVLNKFCVIQMMHDVSSKW